MTQSVHERAQVVSRLCLGCCYRFRDEAHCLREDGDVLAIPPGGRSCTTPSVHRPSSGFGFQERGLCLSGAVLGCWGSTPASEGSPPQPLPQPGSPGPTCLWAMTYGPSCPGPPRRMKAQTAPGFWQKDSQMSRRARTLWAQGGACLYHLPVSSGSGA